MFVTFITISIISELFNFNGILSIYRDTRACILDLCIQDILVKRLAFSECVALIILISLFFKKCILRRSTLLKKISVFGAKKCWIRFASKFQQLRVIHNLLKDSLPRTKVFQTLERNKQHKLYIL